MLQEKLESLQEAATVRKARLVDNSAFLQFMWKTDVVESWISGLFYTEKTLSTLPIERKAVTRFVGD